MTVRHGAVTLDWLGQTSVRVEGRTGVVVYADPQASAPGLDRPKDGDLVLVRGPDTYDPEGIRRVVHDESIVVVHESVDAVDPKGVEYETEPVRDHESFVLGPLDLYTTPVRGGVDSETTQPRSNSSPASASAEGCGFGLTMDGVTILVPGATKILDEHRDLHVDVLVVQPGSGAHPDWRGATALAKHLRPGLVFPVGSETGGEHRSLLETFVLELATDGVPIALDRRESKT